MNALGGYQFGCWWHLNKDTYQKQETDSLT